MPKRWCYVEDTVVGDLVTTVKGERVGIVTNIRNNGSMDIVWIGDNKRGLVSRWWLYIYSKCKKDLNKI